MQNEVSAQDEGQESSAHPSSSYKDADEPDGAQLYSVPIDSDGTSNNMLGTIKTSKSQIQASSVPRVQETDPEEDYTPDSEQPSEMYD